MKGEAIGAGLLALGWWLEHPGRSPLRGYYHADGTTMIQEIIRRWSEDGDKLYDDSMPVLIPKRDLLPYREYRWTREQARRSPEEWDQLVEWMQEHGWPEDHPAHVMVDKDGTARLGEGNHRLAIALDMPSIEHVPVWFHFNMGAGRW